MTTRIVQPTSHFWLAKFHEQLAGIHRKGKAEPLERFFALDIALAYLYLYMFLEGTIDQVIWGLLNHTRPLQATQQYRKRGRYLRDKLEFIFSEFCPELAFAEFSSLKQGTKGLNAIRNSIVHLEELSWTVWLDKHERLRERPTGSTQYLTVRDLKQNYREVRDFLSRLAITLNRGLHNPSIRLEYREGARRELKTRNLIEFIFESVPIMRDFEECP